MRKLSENHALSSGKTLVIVFLLSILKKSRLYITMHVVQFLTYDVIDPSHKSFWSKLIMQFKSLKGSYAPKVLSTTTYIYHKLKMSWIANNQIKSI